MVRLLKVFASLTPFLNRRLAHFLGLGVALMATSVLSYTVSMALFLNQVGAEALPLLHVSLGMVSIPVSLWIYRLIDTVPRLPLSRSLLIGSGVWVCLLRILLFLHVPTSYYWVAISLNLLDLVLGILFWTIVADHFTSREVERYTIPLAMAMTLGSMVGGWAIHELGQRMTAENLMLGLPLMAGVMVAQLCWLGRSEPLLEPDCVKPESTTLWATLKTFPRLLHRYPLVVWLAVGMLICVMLWQLSELQFYTIYTASWPEQQQLTQFLGLLSAVLSPLELVVTYFLTRPLLLAGGGRSLNLLYPLTTLVSFLMLVWNFQLPAAIFANINYDTLWSSIAQPVQNLNYNALPYRFVGRTRVIIDGLIYPIGQAIVGLVLFFLRAHLPAFQLAWVGVGLSGLALGVGYLTGRSYVQAVVNRLQTGSLNLGEVSQNLTRLPTRYITDIQQLLHSEDPNAQILGLQLATRLEDPSPLLEEVPQLLLQASESVRQAVIQFLIHGHHAEFHRYLRTHLVADNPIVREAVLEALIQSQQPLSDVQLCFFLEDASPPVRALACVAVRQAGEVSPQVQAAYEQVWRFSGGKGKTMAPHARRAVIRAISGHAQPLSERSYRQFIPMLQDLLLGADVTVKQEGLAALALLARSDDVVLADWAIAELQHPAAIVRVAAFKLLTVVRSPALLPELLVGLEDSQSIVRQQVTQAIAAYGEASIPLVQSYLNATRPEVSKAAIATLGQLKTHRAEEALWQHLQPYYQQVSLTLAWQSQIPTQEPGWEMLAMAFQDYHQRLIDQMLYVLDCLGHEPTIKTLRRLLGHSDVRSRANAVETLASLGHRRFVQLVLPLLEGLASSDAPTSSRPTPSPSLIHDILNHCHQGWVDRPLTALTEHDVTTMRRYRWLRIGTIMAQIAHEMTIPLGLYQDPDPYVYRVAQYASLPIWERHSIKDFFVNRILFLKTISLLSSLSLDDLLLVNQALDQQEFLAGEVIVKEGDRDQILYMVYQGRVRILKQVKQAQQTLALVETGEYFGEMALLDDSPRSATAIADTDCTLLSLDRLEFENLIAQRPEILQQMCKVLSLRLREANQRLEVLMGGGKLKL